ncbi:hypothetical protein CKO23_21475 [Thiocystis violacea]|nr:hypothetical protein [Thiocystis violacea]
MASERGSLTKTGWDRQTRNGATRPNVRIEDDLNDCRKPFGLERTEEFGERGSTVGNPDPVLNQEVGCPVRRRLAGQEAKAPREHRWNRLDRRPPR